MNYHNYYLLIFFDFGLLQCVSKATVLLLVYVYHLINLILLSSFNYTYCCSTWSIHNLSHIYPQLYERHCYLQSNLTFLTDWFEPTVWSWLLRTMENNWFKVIQKYSLPKVMKVVTHSLSSRLLMIMCALLRWRTSL